jgi:hypothetical protein
VAQDVVIDGYVIAKAGDAAEGQILESRTGEAANAFGFGYEAGDLRVSVDSVYNFCGDTLAMTFDRTVYERPLARRAVVVGFRNRANLFV